MHRIFRIHELMWIILLTFSCQEFYSCKLLKDIRKINLAVVTRYYRVTRHLSCYNWLAFHILSYRFVLWVQGSIRMWTHCRRTLHIAMVCRRGSSVKLRGLMQTKLLRSANLCWPNHGLRAWEWHCGAGLATQALPSRCRRRLYIVVDLTGRMFSGP